METTYRFITLLAIAFLGCSASAVAQHPIEPSSLTARVPFLGIATTEADLTLRSRLGLAEGVGLTVKHVVPGTPAQESGLLRDDVLHRLDDQILTNDPQFRVLLRTHKPGDTIDLTVIRQGQSLKLSVQLGETVVPATRSPCGRFVWTLGPGHRFAPVAGFAGLSARYEDDRHILVLTTDQQGRHLLAKDKHGGILFRGLIDSPEQRKAIPESIHAKLELMENPPNPRTEFATTPE
ncbi:MAG: PDZ domain-containing protein [Planctomycetes bacterium]|nr:PDZ domain-containing protein [Planctomycetota bacterium]